MGLIPKSGEINYSDAATYLNNLGKQPSLPKISPFLTGIFEASHFNTWRVDAHFSGVMFWFCYGEFNGGGANTLYLAAEPKFGFKYPKADPIIASGLSPHQQQILIPIELQGKSLSGSNGDYVLRQNGVVPTRNLTFEDRSSILRKVYKFLSDEDFWELNKYGHGYFEAKDYDIDYFENLLGPLNDNPKYLRYYIGYDQLEAPCKLRIFLIPVDGSGNNIQTLRNPRPGSSSTDPFLLQYSWPPPPKQY